VQKVVICSVFTDNQILGAIIASISVDMVDNSGFAELHSENGFGDLPMLQNVLSIAINGHVPAAVV
jgi:hypothetical protein